MTSTPLHHPRRQQQRGNRYPFTVTIKDVAYVNVGGLVDLPCAYGPSAGNAPQTWETEAPQGERILLKGDHPTIKAGMRAFLNLGSTDVPELKRFEVSDVLPVAHATQTMLIVSPTA